MAASRAALSRERVAKRPQSRVRRVGRKRNFTIVLESVIFFIIASHLAAALLSVSQSHTPHLSAPSTNPQPFNIHDESAAVTHSLQEPSL
jgi:hypothetical protein